MVNYPNLKKASVNVSIPKNSTSKHYTAFRGMSLEEDITYLLIRLSSIKNRRLSRL